MTTLLPRLYILWHRKEKSGEVCSADKAKKQLFTEFPLFFISFHHMVELHVVNWHAHAVYEYVCVCAHHTSGMSMCTSH